LLALEKAMKHKPLRNWWLHKYHSIFIPFVTNH
jgi:hypothetical protein